jgi:hypothetical protein
VVGGAAVLFRQTNAVWVAFVLAASVVRWAGKDHKRFGRLSVEQQLLHVLRMSWQVSIAARPGEDFSHGLALQIVCLFPQARSSGDCPELGTCRAVVGVRPMAKILAASVLIAFQAKGVASHSPLLEVANMPCARVQQTWQLLVL